MWPIGHLAVGYLLFVAVAAWTDRSLPADWRTLTVLAFATQLPDLVDKPLSYWGVLPSGRSLAHSLVVFAVVVVAARLTARAVRARWDADPSIPIPFAVTLPLVVGYLSHLAGDAYGPVLAGEFRHVRFLLWPVLPAIDYGVDNVAPWDRVLAMSLTPQVRLELAIAACALVVFLGLRLWERIR